MTGLDRAIRERLDVDDALPVGEIRWEPYRDALLAVLDLHKPHPTLPSECFRCDSRRPCLTVRRIAEKLGVDAP